MSISPASYISRTFGKTDENGDDIFVPEIFDWNNCDNQTPNKSVYFDTLEEARAYYATIQTRVDYDPFHRIYVHECKWIEDGFYDEDGEFIEGSDICELDFPDYKKEDSDDEE